MEEQNMQPTTHDTEVIEHYSRFLGSEPHVTGIGNVPEGVPNPIAVLEFTPPSEEYDWVYATLGASREAMPDPQHSAGHPTGRRMELIMLSRKQHKELPDLLVTLATYPFVFDTFFL